MLNLISSRQGFGERKKERKKERKTDFAAIVCLYVTYKRVLTWAYF